MVTMTIKIKKVKDNAKIPKRATNGSAGMDLYACIDEKITINPGQLVLVPTGIAMNFPTTALPHFSMQEAVLESSTASAFQTVWVLLTATTAEKSAQVFAMFRTSPMRLSRLRESVRWSSLPLFRVMLKRLQNLATQSAVRAVLAQQAKNKKISTIYHCP